MNKQNEAMGQQPPPPYPTTGNNPPAPAGTASNYNTQYAQPIPTQYGVGQPIGAPPGPPPSHMPPGGGWQQTAQVPVYVTQTTAYRNGTNMDTGTFQSLRTAIPELPMGVAITLCVINCILPGIGTIIAGFCVFCCGNPGQSGGGKFGTFCINFWIGIAQLVTLIFTVGWIWSIMWGVAFIAISDEGRRKRQGVGDTATTTVTTTAVPPHPGSYPGQASTIPH